MSLFWKEKLKTQNIEVLTKDLNQAKPKAGSRAYLRFKNPSDFNLPQDTFWSRVLLEQEIDDDSSTFNFSIDRVTAIGTPTRGCVVQDPGHACENYTYIFSSNATDDRKQMIIDENHIQNSPPRNDLRRDIQINC